MKKGKTGFEKQARAIRKEIISMLVPTESHHIGCSLSIVEILAALYFGELKINPRKPKSQLRDIFILSKGHAAAALYATLAIKGFFSKALLSQYDTDGGILPEHTTTAAPGVEASTGSLGHGLSIGAGFAMGQKNDKRKSRTFVLISDGELNEGSTWEAIMFAGHHQLQNLIVILDYNKFQGYGATKDILDIEPIEDKLKLFGWNAYEADGHSEKELRNAFKAIRSAKNTRPHFLIAHTIKGKGIPHFEGKFESHYHSIDRETKKKLLAEFKS